MFRWHCDRRRLLPFAIGHQSIRISLWHWTSLNLISTWYYHDSKGKGVKSTPFFKTNYTNTPLIVSLVTQLEHCYCLHLVGFLLKYKTTNYLTITAKKSAKPKTKNFLKFTLLSKQEFQKYFRNSTTCTDWLISLGFSVNFPFLQQNIALKVWQLQMDIIPGVSNIHKIGIHIKFVLFKGFVSVSFKAKTEYCRFVMLKTKLTKFLYNARLNQSQWPAFSTCTITIKQIMFLFLGRVRLSF